MAETPTAAVTAHFSNLQDRRDKNKPHQLLDTVIIAINAAICGADSWEDVELWRRQTQLV